MEFSKHYLSFQHTPILLSTPWVPSLFLYILTYPESQLVKSNSLLLNLHRNSWIQIKEKHLNPDWSQFKVITTEKKWVLRATTFSQSISLFFPSVGPRTEIISHLLSLFKPWTPLPTYLQSAGEWPCLFHYENNRNNREHPPTNSINLLANVPYILSSFLLQNLQSMLLLKAHLRTGFHVLFAQGQCSYSFASPSYYKTFSLYWVISKNIQACSSNNSHLKGKNNPMTPHLPATTALLCFCSFTTHSKSCL